MLTTSQLARSHGTAAQDLGTGDFRPQKARVKRGSDPFDEQLARDKIRQARKLALLGATDDEIASFFEITTRQLYNWKHMHPEFAEALRDAKAEADERVERTLYQKAIGYTFNSEKIFCTDGMVTRVPIREHVPPSDTAMIFWLKNRKPAEWRDQRDVKLEGSIATTPLIDRDVALAVLNMLVEAAEQPVQIEGEVTDVDT